MRLSFPVGAKRDLIDDDDLLRHLKARESRGSKVADLLNRLIEVLPGMSTTAAATRLAEHRMGNAKDYRLSDRRMLQQRLLNQSRRDLLAAAIDDFLQPTGDEQIAIRIEMAEIAGAEPTFRESRLVRRRSRHHSAG